MTHTVEFAPEALEQLTALYRYMATAASPDIAQRYTDAIVSRGSRRRMNTPRTQNSRNVGALMAVEPRRRCPPATGSKAPI